MTTTTEKYVTIITEYKSFNISSYGKELTEQLNTEISEMETKQSENTQQNNEKIDGYAKLHDQHKQLQRDNTASHEARKGLLDDINGANNDYHKFANDATEEHSGLRDKIASTEHPLRVLQNEVTNLHLDNKNLQQVIDTEAALREAKAQAELSAVTTVNTDLKAQTERIQNDINEERSKRGDAQKILDELNGKFNDAEKALKALLDQAQKDRDEVQRNLENVRGDLGKTRSTNDDLRNQADSSAKTVAQFREAVNQLSSDMEALKATNEEDVRRLEEQRQNNDQRINDMRNKLSDADHDHENLKILIEKTRNEISYLSSEKEKHQSQNYQKRIDDFLKNIDDSEKKSQFLIDELNRLNSEWKDRLQRVTKETEGTIRSNEHEEHVKKIERLLHELDLKNQELQKLKDRRDALQKEVSNEDSKDKDNKNSKARQELDEVNKQLLDVLNEKNGMYDDLVRNTRELLDIDAEIMANSQELARLTQENGILRKELEQKEKIIYDLRIILEERKREIEELKQLIEDLKATLKDRDAEAERLRKLAKEKEDQIRELERQLEDMKAKPPTPEPVVEQPEEPVIDITDDVDAMLAQYINIAGCPVPIKRLGGGYYMFGTKKIYAKILNGKLVIRVGGGYMNIEEFIKVYADQELLKVNARRQKGLDIFTGKPLGEEDSKGRSPKGRKSPKGGRSPKGGKSPKGLSSTIKGTDCPTQLTADDIKKYKGN